MSIHTASLHRRIEPANRSRARGLYFVLRSSHVPMHSAYRATVATYGRPLIRGFYWDTLSTQVRRLVVALS